jgi:uncharacterized protein YgiM (DUF1202 family)
MDRRFFILSATAVSVIGAPSFADTMLINSPGDGFLNLRTGPGSNFDVIRKMYHGSRVETLETSGNWVRVRHESGAVGWTFAKYLARPSAGSYHVYSPGDGYLNLRTGPGTKFDIIRRMYNGEDVRILEVSGAWARVKHYDSGATGWCSTKFLQR